MTREQVGQMLEKVSAVYPNTYRGMDERQRARIIDEWYRSLSRYPVQICQKAWERYKTKTLMRELNIGLFVGHVKDVIENERREQMKNAIPAPAEPERNSEWSEARKECMRKCSELFGRNYEQVRK